MNLQYVRGLPMNISFSFKRENVEQAMDHRPEDGDIIISTYPKAGTTWVQYIVYQVLHKAERYPSFQDSIMGVMPYIDYVGTEALSKLEKPRFCKTHLPYSAMNINPKAKYIYVHRDPKDVAVSFYYFEKNLEYQGREFVDFNEYVDRFLTGYIGYGDYFDHVLSFYEHKDDSNLLILSFEDIKKDHPAAVMKIAKFLGDQYHQALLEDNALFQKIVTVTSFDYMKKHLDFSSFEKFKPGNVDETETQYQFKAVENCEEDPNFCFFRKGVVGDGKEHLDAEQLKRFELKISTRMRNTPFVKAWLN